MKLLFTTICYVLTMSALLAQPILLHVFDAESNDPISYVNVSAKVDRHPFFKTTNLKGEVDITELEHYKGTIVISSLGYQTIETTFQYLRTQGFKIQLALTNLALDQVIVSATRYAQPKSTTPMKVTAISAKEIEFNNPQTAADLLGNSGEVFIQKSQQGGGSPMIRGFATNRLLITVDGIRMNTAIFRSGNVQNVISIDPLNVSRTEVLFGPNSVIYGSDAIGGVMSFITQKPQLAVSGTNQPNVSGNAIARYATASNEFTGHFDVNLGWKKVAFLMAYTRNLFGDLQMGSNGPTEYQRPWFVETRNNIDHVIENDDLNLQVPTGYAQDNVMGKVLYQLNSVWDFNYSFHFSETSNYARYDRLIETKNDLPVNAVWEYGPQSWMMNNLQVHNIANNDLFDEFTVRMAHQQFGESRIDRKFQDSTRRERTEDVLALSLNADFVKSLGRRSTFFYGGEFVYNDVNSTGMQTNIFTNETSKATARYPLSQWYSYAVYVTNQFRVSDHWLIHAGLRYNYFVLDADFSNNAELNLPFETSRNENDALTGSLGVEFNSETNWTFSTNVSTGFRSPNVDDIGKIFDSEPGSVVVPNPNLKPEYAYNVEVDVAKVFWNAFKLDVAVFYTYLENAMVRRNSTADGQDSIIYDGTLSQVQTVQNAAEAFVYGTEVGLEIDLPAGFSISSHYNFQRGFEVEDGEENIPLRHAAPQFGMTKLVYTHKKLVMQLDAVYSGEMTYDDLPPSEQEKPHIYAIDANGNPFSPAWYTLNLRTEYRLNKNLGFTFAIENITDQRYRPYSSGLAGAGRNFVAAIKASF